MRYVWSIETTSPTTISQADSSVPDFVVTGGPFPPNGYKLLSGDDIVYSIDVIDETDTVVASISEVTVMDLNHLLFRFSPKKTGTYKAIVMLTRDPKNARFLEEIDFPSVLEGLEEAKETTTVVEDTSAIEQPSSESPKQFLSEPLEPETSPKAISNTFIADVQSSRDSASLSEQHISNLLELQNILRKESARSKKDKADRARKQAQAEKQAEVEKQAEAEREAEAEAEAVKEAKEEAEKAAEQAMLLAEEEENIAQEMSSPSNTRKSNHRSKSSSSDITSSSRDQRVAKSNRKKAKLSTKSIAKNLIVVENPNVKQSKSVPSESAKSKHPKTKLAPKNKQMALASKEKHNTVKQLREKGVQQKAKPRAS